MNLNANVLYDWDIDDDESYRTPEQKQKEQEYLEKDIDALCDTCSGAGSFAMFIVVVFLLVNALINLIFS